MTSISGRVATGIVALCAISCAPAPEPAPADPVDAAVAAAARYLWERQGEDGGWHSERYGLLRSGQSLTPFVLDALLDVPDTVYDTNPGRADRALTFIADHVDADGALGRVDPLCEDYPNYATGLAVRVLARAGRGGELTQRMLACLRTQQFTERGGWDSAHGSYGAWGMGGAARIPPWPGHLDLSMTRYVLEGFAAAGSGPDDPAIHKAARFLRRCGNDDGGFLFSPVVADANKRGDASYGTATADGLLALLASGCDAADPRVARARAWLESRHRVDLVPGFEDEPPDGWGVAMVHYYRAASARAFAALDVERLPVGRDWRAEMAAALLSEQHPDGSFVNPNVLMKEDDPLIATTLALQALLACRSAPVRERSSLRVRPPHADSARHAGTPLPAR